jgi:hypothetical protein
MQFFLSVAVLIVFASSLPAVMNTLRIKRGSRAAACLADNCGSSADRYVLRLILFDHIVGSDVQCRRNSDTKRLSMTDLNV